MNRVTVFVEIPGESSLIGSIRAVKTALANLDALITGPPAIEDLGIPVELAFDLVHPVGGYKIGTVHAEYEAD